MCLDYFKFYALGFQLGFESRLDIKIHLISLFG